MKNWISEITLFFGIFSLLFVCSFSFPFQIIPDIGGRLEPLFNQLVDFETGFFEVKVDPYHSGEDSVGLVYNLINVFSLTVVVFCILYFFIRKEVRDKLADGTQVFIRYYLALILLIYGFDKVYKWQFYSPESNILYTRVKDLPQDMLYWTTMGTSYSYSVITGLIEVIGAIFLLFRRTLLVGALVSLAALANVFLANVGFGITVKIYSGFLFLLCFVLLLPNLRSLIGVLIGSGGSIEIKNPTYAKGIYYGYIKTVFVLMILVESQYKYIVSRNFNDDLSSRPHFNGAYQVVDGEGDVVRVHFHRHGYFILEMIDGQFYDFSLIIDSIGHKLIIQDYNEHQDTFFYEEVGDTLKIEDENSTFHLVTVKLNL